MTRQSLRALTSQIGGFRRSVPSKEQQSLRMRELGIVANGPALSRDIENAAERRVAREVGAVLEKALEGLVLHQ